MRPSSGTSFLCTSSFIVCQQLLDGLCPGSLGIWHHSTVAEVGFKQSSAQGCRLYAQIWLDLHASRALMHAPLANRSCTLAYGRLIL